MIFAWRLWPAWDDGWLAMALRELGPGELPRVYGDRPLVAHAWALLAARGWLLPASAILLAGSQLSLGLAARDVWKRVFPDAGDGWLAACVAAAPVVYTMPFVLVNPTWAGMLGPALVWPAARAIHARRWYVGVPLLIVAALLSEYAFAAALAAALIYRDRRTGGLTVGAAAAGLGLYLLIASGGVRPTVRPAFLASTFGSQLLTLPLRFVGAIVYAAFGALARDAAHLAFSIASLAGALVVGGLLGTARTARPGRRQIEVLLVALVVGIGPALLAGRDPGGGGASRYFLPVLPIAACLPVAILGWLAPRATPVLVGVLLGATTIGGGVAAIGERPAALQPQPGALVLAVVDPSLPRTPMWTHQDYEWTARLTDGWSAEDARRFWVVPDGEARRWVGERDACIGRPFSRSVRGVTRFGRADRILWIDAAGVQQYCK